MKVAIIGAGPLGIEMGVSLIQLGANITIFEQDEVGGSICQLPPDFPLLSAYHQLVSQRGLSQIQLSNLEYSPTASEYLTQYLLPLCKINNLDKWIKKAKVMRVHKKFLSPDEEISGKSRLQDLFRIVYVKNKVEDLPFIPSEIINKVDDQVLESLKSPIEFYDDFDLVIDATGVLQNPSPAGASNTPAVGEQSARASGQIYYGQNSFLQNKEKIKLANHIAIIGSGNTAAMMIHELKEWFKNDLSRLTIVTAANIPFENIQFDQFETSVVEIKKHNLDNHEQASINFQYQMNIWKELEEYEKAKVSKPVEPVIKLNILKGHNVISIDKLIDQDKIYLTCEAPNFRDEVGNAYSTIAADIILVASGYQKDNSIYSGLRIEYNWGNKTSVSPFGIHAESGFYNLGNVTSKDRYQIEDGLKQIPEIEKNILSFFTRAGV